MPLYIDSKRTFLNRRSWSTYLSAVQNAAPYPKVIEAVKTGRAWLSQGATEASVWLVGGADLSEKTLSRG